MKTKDNESKRVALIAGASGLVGGLTLRSLLDESRYGTVIALVRKPLPTTHAKLTQHVVNFDRLAEWTSAVPVNDVFCCLGTTIKIAGSQEAFRRVDYEYPLALGQWAERNKASTFLLVSAMGADALSRVFYNRVKGEVEAALQRLLLPSLHIFRPSLLLGDRLESRLGERMGAIVMKMLRPVMLGSLRSYRAIKASDVARALVTAAGSSSSGVSIYDSAQIQGLADSSL